MIRSLLHDALDRTLLLMRDELVPDTTDDALLNALTSPQIALVADRANMASNSAQAAFVTAALVMARSGHRVILIAPEVALHQIVAPLRAEGLISSLVECGRDLLPGIRFALEPPRVPVDLEVRFGNSRSTVAATRSIAVEADAWRMRLGCSAELWARSASPFGGMAAGAAIGAEAFKVSMMRLRHLARDRRAFDELFAPALGVDLALAPVGTPVANRFGEFELISAGAISQAFLYALSRIPGVVGHGRTYDDDFYGISNLNRYSVTRFGDVPKQKVWHLSRLRLGGIRLEPVPERFHAATAISRGFQSNILIGADDIPARWDAQRHAPHWLGVGATTHWSAMASAHPAGGACAACLHPVDDPAPPRIPTVAFVSFWAGLLLASYFAQETIGRPVSIREQQTYLTPLRLEGLWRSGIARHPHCPLGPHRDAA
jgi:hypothetical protein